MSALKQSPVAMGLLAIAALWWITQRRAVAGTVTGNPAYGSQGAVQSGAMQRYLVPPSGTRLPAQQSPLNSLLAAGLQLLGRNSAKSAAAAYSNGGPSSGVYGVEPAQNAYGFDAPQPGQDLVNAYSFGGPSMGVYGSTGADLVRPLGPDRAYYGTIVDPATFTGDPYNDGGGYLDAVAASPAPNDWANVDWSNPEYGNPW